MTTLTTVRCFRERNNLKLLLGCLNDAVQLCFCHIHYSRWLSVFIHDLELLTVENIDLPVKECVFEGRCLFPMLELCPKPLSGTGGRCHFGHDQKK